MQDNRLRAVLDYIVKHCKIVFPVLVIAAVAATVTIALNANKARAEEESLPTESTGEEIPETWTPPAPEDNPLIPNENEELEALMISYYNAVAAGDTETLKAIYSEISSNELLKFQEKAKYLNRYSNLEIYTRPGPEENSIIALVYYKVVFENREEEVPGLRSFYVCTDDQGKLYINNGNVSDEINEYFMSVSRQSDVVDLSNRVNMEYNELMDTHQDLLRYLAELDAEVDTAVGEALARENGDMPVDPADTADPASSENPGEAGNPGEAADPGTDPGNTADPGSTVDPGAAGEGQEPVPEAPVNTGPQYATATTTVNVRDSDSELAEKLGKVRGGEKVQVQQILQNGWTKIVYEGADGFIKSEYLQIVENADGIASIGTVTATENVNVRAAASETAERLGLLTGGTTLELLANEGDWCKVKYNGQVGYVKSEYVQ
ncbi:MAG: SH3 domain-containing protein [Acetatifactor sp.]|nr:SH3 domain-containing protein [Acetatifactor sp.]